jgi:hypothetical protein
MKSKPWVDVYKGSEKRKGKEKNKPFTEKGKKKNKPFTRDLKSLVYMCSSVMENAAFFSHGLP